MKIKKIISKSKDENRMEVIAEDAHGNLRTLHIQRYSKDWKYCDGHQDNRPILKSISVA